jgi:hypothetical protein
MTNVYFLTTKELEELKETLENDIYKLKKRQFKHDPTYIPTKTEIPLKCLKTALQKYKL